MIRSINTNDSSLNVQRLRTQADSAAETSLQRLSSSLRINGESAELATPSQGDQRLARHANDGVLLTLSNQEAVQADFDSNPKISAEQPATARPALRDAGLAQELASLTSNQITAHPDIALLAHANVSSQSALSVLQ